jgi:EmrB/QacA subfamily drug resistance transporter
MRPLITDKDPMTTSPQKWAIGLTGIASFMVALDQIVVSTALTRIQQDLGASLTELEWTVNAYTLTFAGLLMFGSALGDRLGRRRMFAVGIAVFIAGSIACAASTSIGWLIAARAFQGVGGALVMPLAMALLTAAFPPQQRAKALGIFSAITGVAVLSGPVIGGAIAQGIDWQWIFWINVPVGLATLPLVVRRLPESRGPNTAFDALGAILVTAAALGLIWGLIRGNSAGWSSAEVLAALVAGAAALVAFVSWELHAPAPMLPLRLVRRGSYSGGVAGGFFLTAALMGFLFFVTQFLQVAHGDGPLAAGLHLLPWTATLFVIAPLAGARLPRIGTRPLITGGLALQALGFGLIAAIASDHVAAWALVAPLIIAGCGVSAALVATQTAAVSEAQPDEIGKAAGTFITMRFLGSAFGISILSAVFAAHGDFASPAGFADGFRYAAGVAAALSLAGAFAGLFTGRRSASAPLVPAAPPAAEALRP